MCFLCVFPCVRMYMGACVCLAENRKLLHEQNVEKVLVELLSVADVSVKTATCQALAAMSFHLASKDTFRDLGTVHTNPHNHHDIETLTTMRCE